jgi:hypothetical protein
LLVLDVGQGSAPLTASAGNYKNHEVGEFP